MIGSYYFILLLLFSLWHTPIHICKVLIVEVNKTKNTKDPKQRTVTKGQVNFTSSIGLRNVTCVGKWFHTLEDSGAVSGSENKSASTTMIQGHPCIRFRSVHTLRGQKKHSTQLIGTSLSLPCLSTELLHPISDLGMVMVSDS